MTRTVVFDLDGTLADTSGDLIAAANQCFRDLGHGDLLNPAHDAGTALKGGRAMLNLGFSRVRDDDFSALVDAQYPRLLEAYAAAIDRHTTLYPGTVDAIEELTRRGMRSVICTNKPAGLAETLMTSLGVRQMFHALVGADTLPVRKPDPKPYHEAVSRGGGVSNRSVMIGDTITDRATATAAGVPCVLVTFSPDGDQVSRHKPEALLHDYRDLPDLVETLLEP